MRRQSRQVPLLALSKLRVRINEGDDQWSLAANDRRLRRLPPSALAAEETLLTTRVIATADGTVIFYDDKMSCRGWERNSRPSNLPDAASIGSSINSCRLLTGRLKQKHTPKPTMPFLKRLKHAWFWGLTRPAYDLTWGAYTPYLRHQLYAQAGTINSVLWQQLHL